MLPLKQRIRLPKRRFSGFAMDFPRFRAVRQGVMVEDSRSELVGRAAERQYYAYAELDEKDAALFRWTDGHLEALTVASDELSAWRSLTSQLPQENIPCRLQTPAGAGWSMAARGRDRGIAITTCTQPKGQLPSDLISELQLAGELALERLRLRNARRELERQRREQEQLVRHERLRAQADLIRSFSHDFNNLLGTILLRAELGGAASDGQEARAAIAGISRAADDGARLVQHLVNFSGSRPDPDQDLLDVGELVQRLCSEIWAGYEQPPQGVKSPGYALQVECTPDLHVLASPRDLREIMLNLLANAREAMTDGGTVAVEVKRERKQVLVRVSDSGPGLAADELERVIEPFFTTKSRDHLGLGLSVVHGIVARSGGQFALGKSQLGGLMASLSLPLADLRAVRRELRGKEEQDLELLRNLSVLVVDDEPGMRETLALSLENLGHRVTQAVDGRQTLGLLRYHDGLDALVLDLVMPEMDGWEVAYFARKLQPDAAIILLSGWGEALGEQNDGRVDAVLAKPVTMLELNQAISRAVLRRQPHRQAPATGTS